MVKPVKPVKGTAAPACAASATIEPTAEWRKKESFNWGRKVPSIFTSSIILCLRFSFGFAPGFAFHCLSAKRTEAARPLNLIGCLLVGDSAAAAGG